MGYFENPGAVLIVAAILLDALAGIALILAALSMAAAWGWGPAMARREDGRSSPARKLLVAGVAMLGLAVLSVSLIVTFYFVVVVPRDG